MRIWQQKVRKTRTVHAICLAEIVVPMIWMTNNYWPKARKSRKPMRHQSMKTMILRLPLIALYLFLTMIAFAQTLTDRERAGLSGPVYFVTTSTMSHFGGHSKDRQLIEK